MAAFCSCCLSIVGTYRQFDSLKHAYQGEHAQHAQDIPRQERIEIPPPLDLVFFQEFAFIAHAGTIAAGVTVSIVGITGTGIEGAGMVSTCVHALASSNDPTQNCTFRLLDSHELRLRCA